MNSLAKKLNEALFEKDTLINHLNSRLRQKDSEISELQEWMQMMEIRVAKFDSSETNTTADRSSSIASEMTEENTDCIQFPKGMISKHQEESI